MCGILGTIGANFEESQFLKILNEIVHRGPDSYGVWHDNEHSIFFGHRRLAVIDLSPAGHQPMHSSDKRFCMVFNGEIYNFQELRRELTFKDWRGHSDTEVLLVAIQEWGLEKTLSKATGMFAFALWDNLQKKLFLARDRFGEKPLFVGKLEKGFFFSSELKPFYKFIKKEFNHDAISTYFKLGYIPHPLTIFKNVYKIPPGSFLEIEPNLDRLDISKAKRFWTFNPFNIKRSSLSFDEALNMFESKLEDVIKKQLVSDVPIGCFLSGGIDSSTIVAIAQKTSTTPVNTFSLGIEDQATNEAFFADQVARHLKTNHSQFLVKSKDVVELASNLIPDFDEPFSDPSLIPTWIVSKMARQQVTVCLSGDGGDELFGGYASYARADKIQKMTKVIPEILLNSDLIPNIKYKDIGHKLKKMLKVADSTSYEEIFKKLIFHSNEKITSESIDHNFTINLLKQNREGAMWWDANYYMSDDILVKVDRMSMKHSLEVRVPFMDHQLVEWVWSLPPKYKFNLLNSKILLKETLYRHVPKSLLDRPKMGFGLPVAKWLREDLKDWAFEIIKEDNGIIDQKVVLKFWNQHQSGLIDNKTIIWDVLCFNLWLKRMLPSSLDK